MKAIILTLSLAGFSLVMGKISTNADLKQAQTDGEKKPVISLEGRDDLINFFLQEKPFEFTKAYKTAPKPGEGC
jgi:hypothetical protein